MSLITDILDRLSGVSALRERVVAQDKIVEQMQRLMLDQQRELAEVKGMLKAMAALRGDGARPPLTSPPARKTPRARS